MSVNFKNSDKFFTNIAVQASSGIFTLLDNTDSDSSYEIVSCFAVNISDSVQSTVDIAFYNKNTTNIDGYLCKNTIIDSSETYYIIKNNSPIILDNNHSLIAFCNNDNTSFSSNYCIHTDVVSRNPPVVTGSTPTPTNTTTPTATPAPTVTPTATVIASSGEAGYVVSGAGSPVNDTYCLFDTYNGQPRYRASIVYSGYDLFIQWSIQYPGYWIIGNDDFGIALYAVESPTLESPTFVTTGWITATGDPDPPALSETSCGATTTPDPTTTPTTTPIANQGYLVSNAGSTNVNGTYCYTMRCQDTGTICSPKQMLTKPIDSAEVLDPNTAGMPYYIYQNQTTNTWEIGNGYGTYYTHSSTSNEVPLTGWVLGSIGSSPEPELSTTPC